MFSEMKQEIIDAGIMLDRYELVSLTCGNLRRPHAHRRNSRHPIGYNVMKDVD